MKLMLPENTQMNSSNSIYLHIEIDQRDCSLGFVWVWHLLWIWTLLWVWDLASLVWIWGFIWVGASYGSGVAFYDLWPCMGLGPCKVMEPCKELHMIVRVWGLFLGQEPCKGLEPCIGRGPWISTAFVSAFALNCAVTWATWGGGLPFASYFSTQPQVIPNICTGHPLFIHLN